MIQYSTTVGVVSRAFLTSRSPATFCCFGFTSGPPDKIPPGARSKFKGQIFDRVIFRAVRTAGFGLKSQWETPLHPLLLAGVLTRHSRTSEFDADMLPDSVAPYSGFKSDHYPTIFSGWWIRIQVVIELIQLYIYKL